MGVQLTHEQGFHSRYLQDNPVEPQQLKNSQPRVHRRTSHRGDLDDGRADGQNKIQPVPPFPEEVPPVREASRKPYDNLDVECDGDGELPAVEEPPVDWPWVDCTGGLYCQRSESQDDPKPLGHLVVVFEFVPSGGYQAAIDDTKIVIMPPIDVDNQAGRKMPVSARRRSSGNESLLGCAKCTLLCFFPNRGESVGNHSDEKVDEPEVQDDDAGDVEEAGQEVFRIYCQVHWASEL